MSAVGVHFPSGMTTPVGLPSPETYSVVKERDAQPEGAPNLDREVPQDVVMKDTVEPDPQPVLSSMPLPEQIETSPPGDGVEPLT